MFAPYETSLLFSLKSLQNEFDTFYVILMEKQNVVHARSSLARIVNVASVANCPQPRFVVSSSLNCAIDIHPDFRCAKSYPSFYSKALKQKMLVPKFNMIFPHVLQDKI